MSVSTTKCTAVLLLVIAIALFSFYSLDIPPNYSRHVAQKILHTMNNLTEKPFNQSGHHFLEAAMNGNESTVNISPITPALPRLMKYLTKCKKMRKKAVIIYAPTRSGSTFLGEFFNQHSEIYYLFEPLHYVGYQMKNVSAIQEIVMRDLLLCNYSRIPKLYEDHFNDKWANCKSNLCYSSRSKFLWRNTQLCSRDPPYCGVPKFDPRALEKICQQSLFTAIKVISLTSLSSLVPLLADPRLDLKIIQLIRDPRAVVPSQMRMVGDNKTSTLVKITGRLCSRYHNDWLYHQHCILGYKPTESSTIDSKYCNKSTRTLWKDKLMRLSHEFISEDPMRAMTIIYKFVGLNFDENVANWIGASTNSAFNRSVWNDKSDHKNGFYGTNRDSKNLLKKWRLNEPFSTIRYIENHCENAMEDLGYIPAKTLKRLASISSDLYSTAKSVFMPMIKS